VIKISASCSQTVLIQEPVRHTWDSSEPVPVSQWAVGVEVLIYRSQYCQQRLNTCTYRKNLRLYVQSEENDNAYPPKGNISKYKLCTNVFQYVINFQSVQPTIRSDRITAKQDAKMLAELNWFGTGSDGGLLWIWYEPSSPMKMGWSRDTYSFKDRFPNGNT
jgi:hypothetical protein